MHYGFIGLGNLGAHLAANLLKAGFEVSVHDLDRATASQLEPKGAVWADTPAALAQMADAVITCLPSPRHIRSNPSRNPPCNARRCHLDRDVDLRT